MAAPARKVAEGETWAHKMPPSTGTTRAETWLIVWAMLTLLVISAGEWEIF